MSAGAVVQGHARTPFGSLGGALAPLRLSDLALTAARGAIDRAGIDPRELAAIVTAVGLPTESEDLALAAALAGPLGLKSRVPTATLLGLDAAAEALATGIGLATADGGPTLVVAADSASRAAYWVPDLRLGASEQGATVIDPLGPALDPLSEAGSPSYLLEAAAEARGISRVEQDEFSARSHRHAEARNGTRTGPVIPQPLPGEALETDELLRSELSAEKLEACPPIHTAGGSLTAANTAQPIDGAAALVLGAENGSGPTLAAPLRRAPAKPDSSAAEGAARAALERVGLDGSHVETVRLAECSAAQAIIAISDLGLDPTQVNRGGGCLACGRQLGGGAVALAVDLVAELDAAGATTGLLADEGPARTGIAAVLRS